jgi:hypothetical protein
LGQRGCETTQIKLATNLERAPIDTRPPDLRRSAVQELSVGGQKSRSTVAKHFTDRPRALPLSLRQVACGVQARQEWRSGPDRALARRVRPLNSPPLLTFVYVEPILHRWDTGSAHLNSLQMFKVSQRLATLDAISIAPLGEIRSVGNESLRVDRRLFRWSHAAMACSSSLVARFNDFARI